MKHLIDVNWLDFTNYIEIVTPEPFSFEECLVYLDRADSECLHKVEDGSLFKFVQWEDFKVLLKITSGGQNLRVDFLNGVPPTWVRAEAAKYVFDWFDMQTELASFYEMSSRDPILKPLSEKYKGLRIVKIHDLFECLCWAVIGQQINLKFAYTLKKRLVEKYGVKLIFEGEEYFAFPSPAVISGLQIEDLKPLQFTTRKAEYIIGIAKLFVEGRINKEELAMELDYDQLLKKLISIRGIGNWTADYTIMKCFNLNCAFPLADVGIHNALKGIMGMEVKPSLTDIQEFAKGWKGWEAYAAFYLWRWLYD